MNQTTDYKLSVCDYNVDAKTHCDYTEIGTITRNSDGEVISTNLSLTTSILEVDDLQKQLLELFKDKDFNKGVTETANLKKPKVLTSGETKLVIFKFSPYYPWVSICAIQLTNTDIRYLFYAYEKIVGPWEMYKYKKTPGCLYLDEVHSEFSHQNLKFYLKNNNEILKSLSGEFVPTNFGLA